ncbi:RNA-directed DNA polymerase, eukaryota [Tanacetum coccineum]
MAGRNRSNEDHVRSISKSIFITNFPDHTTSSDLWKLCQAYGSVVDVFIPNRRSKMGKRFAFARFIKVDGIFMLMWPSNATPSYISVVKGVSNPPFSVSPALVLDDTLVVNNPCLGNQDPSSCLELENSFLKIGAKWGEVLDLEEGKDDFFARKRICIKTKQEENILEKFKIIVKGKVFVVRAKELFTWSPSFSDVLETAYSSDDESAKDEGINQFESSEQVNLEEESDDEVVSDTHFGDNKEKEGTSNESVINSGCSSRIMESSQKINEELHAEGYQNVVKNREGGSILELLEEMITVGQTMGFSMEGCNKDMEKIIGSQGDNKALGNSGGILCAWDNNVLCKEHHTISDNFIAVFGTWIPTKMKVMIISVYAPQADSYKRALWSYLELLVNRWNGESIIMGDFNEVRRKEERWGSTFNAHGARVFNNFISNAGLVDLQLEGFSFTWSHPSASKMSKLDRFLVTDGLISSFPHISAVCLDRHLSDHRPYLAPGGITRFGATPFRLYHSWFSFQGFDQMVSHVWNSTSLNDSNDMIRFKKKLQILKKQIRVFVVDQKKKRGGCVKDLKDKLSDIDSILDKGGVNDDYSSSPVRKLILTFFLMLKSC